MEKIPLRAIEEGIDAFRHILVLEQRRARLRTRRVAVRQGARAGLLATAGVVMAFALHLLFFWATVALYQRGWSIGGIGLGIAAFALVFAGLSVLVGSRLTRSAPLTSIVRMPHERTREDGKGTGVRKEAA